MANIKECLEDLMQVEGALGAAIVDYKSGMALGMIGGGLNLEVAAAGNTEVIRAKIKTMQNLGLQDRIEDILITLGKQYHLIRLSEKIPNVFFYYALDKQRANLALARMKLTSAEGNLQL
jgi:hypothetical protein